MALIDPIGAILELARRSPLPSDFHEQLECGLGIRDDAQLGAEHPAYLGGLDVDMDELAALRVGIDAAGVAIGPAIADAQHEVRFQKRRISVAVGGLQAHHAHHQRVIVGDGAPAHERRDDRHTGNLGELHQKRRCVGVDDATTRDDERPLGIVQHGERLLDLGAVSRRLICRQGSIGVRIKLDLRHLHVEWKINKHWPRPP